MKTSGRRRGRKEGGRKSTKMEFINLSLVNLQTEERNVIEVKGEFVTPQTEGAAEVEPAVAPAVEPEQDVEPERETPLSRKKARKSLSSKWSAKWRTKWTVTSRRLKFRKSPPKTNLELEFVTPQTEGAAEVEPEVAPEVEPEQEVQPEQETPLLRSSRYVCDTCKKKFTYQKNWMKHSCGTPIPPEELRCELCGTEFTQKNNKRRHMRSKHENPAHFSCEYCKKTYSRADNCKAHIKVCPLKLSDLE